MDLYLVRTPDRFFIGLNAAGHVLATPRLSLAKKLTLAEARATVTQLIAAGYRPVITNLRGESIADLEAQKQEQDAADAARFNNFWGV